jgi:uncharacterized protein (UPF0303 family)
MRLINDLTASEILAKERSLVLTRLEISDALALGELAKSIGYKRKLPIAIEVRINEWVVYHASLPGSTRDNQEWLDRKSRVVFLTHRSTLFEQLRAKERGINWFQENNLKEEEYAIHGGGLPLATKNYGIVGALLISGLLQVEDHLFGVEVLTEFLAGNTELP